MKRHLHRWLAATCIATVAAGAFAQDRADIDRTQIIGNRELPKVLYIVPWKRPVHGNLERPVKGIVDDVFSPVDRDVLRRQVSYDAQVRAGAANAAAAAATGGTTTTIPPR